MNCQFCNKKYRLVSAGGNYEWFLCDYCNILYRQNYDGVLEIIRFKTTLNDEKYCLDLKLKDSTSEILHLKKKEILILHLPFLVKGITPSNCQDKIKTYITFL